MEYRKGKYNTVPDALSSAPLDIKEPGVLTCYTALSLKFKSEKTELLPLPITDYDIWKAQQTDLDIQNLYEQIVESGEVTVNSSTKFTILEDKVYRVVQFPHKTVYQVYIPKALRSQLLQSLHEDPLAGHLGQFKTCKRLQALVYWPNLNQNVKEFVQNCHICQLHMPECRKPPGSLGTNHCTTAMGDAWSRLNGSISQEFFNECLSAGFCGLLFSMGETFQFT